MASNDGEWGSPVGHIFRALCHAKYSFTLLAPYLHNPPGKIPVHGNLPGNSGY